MSKIQELRKKAGEKAAEIRKLGDAYNARLAARKGNEPLWPDNTRADWDRTNAEYDAIRVEIDAETENDKITARMESLTKWEERSQTNDKPGLDDNFPGREETYGDRGFRDARSVAEFEKREVDRRNVMRTFIAGHIEGGGLITSEMRESCQRLNFQNAPGNRSMPMQLLQTDSLNSLRSQARHRHPSLLADSRSMSKGGAGVGAELIPITFLETFELTALATAELFLYCDIMRTATGEQIKWPIGDDSANEGVQISEADDINALAQPDAALEQLTLGAYDFTSGIVKVSNQLSRDSIPNIDVILAEMLASRLTRIKLRRATTGNGTTQPGGVVTAAPVGVTTALATAIAPSEIVKLQHSVDPVYRSESRFMSHDTIVQTLRLLNDSQNRPLWQSGLQDGVPDRLCGQGLIYNQYMASTVATTNVTMLYGAFRYYKAREVGQVILSKLVERFAEKLQTGFMAYQAFDGRLQKWANAAAAPVKALKQA